MLGYTSRSSINKIEKGINGLSQQRIIDFAHVFDISFDQLINDEELDMGSITNKWTKDEHDSQKRIQEIVGEEIRSVFGEEIYQHFDKYLDLNKEGRRAVDTYLQILLEVPRLRLNSGLTNDATLPSKLQLNFDYERE